MAGVIEQIRNVCALGALQSVVAIERAIPIIHAGPGCGQKLWSGLSNGNGFQGAGYVGGHSVPCTNATEQEVVFGGEEKLRETVANTLKVMDGDLFVILTGCTSDIVGDDVGEVARSFRSSGAPVVYVETGGFKGDNYFGHELLWDALIDQFLEPAGKAEPGLVNLFSVLPYQDPYWTGTLHTIAGLLRSIGLIPNVIYGPGEGVASLRKVPKAQFNLLLSPWVGLKTVQRLEEKFGTPYLHYPTLPIGATETGKFLRAVGVQAGIPSETVEEAIRREEARYYYYVERSADLLFETRFLPGHFVTVADSFYALGLTKFLINDLGLIPEVQFVTEAVPEQYRPLIDAEFARFDEGLVSPVHYGADGGTVRDELARRTFRERPLILGSSWDRVTARKLNGYPLSVAMPVSDRLVLSRTYAGYEGALRLTEDIYSVILSSFQ
ncbi:nitrogenase component 1 [Geomesophilobacter sediminis]|uniref:Hydrogenase n=1 Tax=Geomesophilobacter sediminis TaxID=2798584 RepID=A0A8J7IMZ1_9BACT|nr:nitrogenase component 1 [Geomesophilobacter sediminis]MBJ6724353.1 hydrogenase [Geomesophilobacter sediminis]